MKSENESKMSARVSSSEHCDNICSVESPNKKLKGIFILFSTNVILRKHVYMMMKGNFQEECLSSNGLFTTAFIFIFCKMCTFTMKKQHK